MNLKSLRRELKAAGVFETREAQTWLKVGALLTLLVGMSVSHAVLPLWSFAFLPVTALVAVIIAMFAHEGGHKALSSSGFRNSLMLYLGFPLFAGLSAQYWRHKHNVKHHAYPNVVEEDPDILLWPMASTHIEYQRSGRFRQWLQRNVQHILFWPFTLFLGWSMRASSVIFLIQYARERGLDRRWWLDVSCMVGHLVLWLVIPSFFVGFWGALLFYGALWTIGGLYLAAIFSPAHMGLPIVSEHDDIWRAQLDHSRNLKVPRGMSWMFVGLDYQIEHHLFPRIPHQHMARASAIIKAWAAKEGVPYQEIGYFAGLRDVTRFMKVAWRVDPQPNGVEPVLIELHPQEPVEAVVTVEAEAA